jgi:uncharacterized protein (DUF488 family)
MSEKYVEGVWTSEVEALLNTWIQNIHRVLGDIFPTCFSYSELV